MAVEADLATLSSPLFKSTDTAACTWLIGGSNNCQKLLSCEINDNVMMMMMMMMMIPCDVF